MQEVAAEIKAGLCVCRYRIQKPVRLAEVSFKQVSVTARAVHIIPKIRVLIQLDLSGGLNVVNLDLLTMPAIRTSNTFTGWSTYISMYSQS